MKNVKKQLTLLLMLLSICHIKVSAQETITEENYLKQDSILWADFQTKYDAMEQIIILHPEKRDSVTAEYEKMIAETYKKNEELAIKYASVPSGLQRLFMVRLELSKDTLKSTLKSLNPEMRNSLYGKSIQEHIKTKQIEEGSPIYEFKCTQEDGTAFDWNSVKGKQLLILYGGLGCIGETGREYLSSVYEKTSRDNFAIIVYWPCGSLEKLNEVKKEYPSDYIFVSDFKQDSSPMKIKYGAQSTPTSVLSDEKHITVVKCTGVAAELFDKHINYLK